MPSLAGWVAVGMQVQQMTLQERVTVALREADAAGDFLIAALLSQCLDIIDHRGAGLPDPVVAAH